MSESLAYGRIRFDENFFLEEILNTLHDSNLCYFIEVDLSYSGKLKNKLKNFFFVRKRN